MTVRILSLCAAIFFVLMIAWACWAAEKPVNPAYAKVTDDPQLPRVLILGDSISIGYTAPVRKLLAGKANVHRPGENCRMTRFGLERIDSWLGDGRWDVIHFNWGLHDIRHVDPNADIADEKNPVQVNLAEYEKNLRALVERLKKTRATLVWCSTTPVPEGAAARKPGDEVTYNAAAAKIMREHQVAINDLHAFAAPQLKKIQQPANVHFTPAGSDVLAEHVSAEILKALSARKAASTK